MLTLSRVDYLIVSIEELPTLVAKLKADPVFKEKMGQAVDTDAALALIREAGFDLGKDDWDVLLSRPGQFLSDQDIEAIAGGKQGWNAAYETKIVACVIK